MPCDWMSCMMAKAKDHELQLPGSIQKRMVTPREHPPFGVVA